MVQPNPLRRSVTAKGASRIRVPRSYGHPVLAVDVIVRNGRNKILLITRAKSPFEGFHALPGGRISYGETVEDAALRELKEECSIDAIPKAILGVYSHPKRDPRGHVVSIVFIADARDSEPRAASDAQSVFWVEPEDILKRKNIQFAFDHRLIIEHYVEWKRTNQGSTFWSSYAMKSR